MVVNLITSIGLSVEFCVHVMLFYLKSNGNRDEKVIFFKKLKLKI